MRKALVISSIVLVSVLFVAAAPAAPSTTAPKPVAAAPATPVVAPMAVVPVPLPVNTATDAMAAAPTTTPAKQDSKASVVGGGILQILLYVIGVLMTALLPVLTAWLYKKLKLTTLEGKDALDAIVLKAALFGIGKAEEAAHKLSDNPISGAEKLKIAIDGANKYLRDSGIPEKGAEYLADLIESKLGLTRTDTTTTAQSATETKTEAAAAKTNTPAAKTDAPAATEAPATPGK